LETEEAQGLTLQIAEQSTSTVYGPESNGDCFVAIVVNDEGFDANLSTRCEQMIVKRIQIVDRVKYDKLKEIKKQYLEQLSKLNKEANPSTRVSLHAELDQLPIGRHNDVGGVNCKYAFYPPSR
jgi:hypothetical protein